MLQKGLVLFTEAPRLTHCGLTGNPIPALEQVANRPIVHHVLDAVLSSGVEEVIVAGTAEVLTEARPCLLQYKSKLRQLEYVICGDSASPLGALRTAAPLVGDAPCLVHPAEGLLAHPVAAYVDSVAATPFDLIHLCSDQVSGGSAEVALFGGGVLRRACELASRAELSTFDAVAGCLSDAGYRVQTCPVDGWRRYAGHPEELLELNRLALDLLPPVPGQMMRHDNQIEGRLHIDPTASVRSSVLVGPTVIAEGASVTNAYVGPYTAIGAGARIEGVEIERSIVAPGAVVTHVGARLVSSLIGRRAQVTRDFALPRAVRLWVGEGDEVALC